MIWILAITLVLSLYKWGKWRLSALIYIAYATEQGIKDMTQDDHKRLMAWVIKNTVNDLLRLKP